MAKDSSTLMTLTDRALWLLSIAAAFAFMTQVGRTFIAPEKTGSSIALRTGALVELPGVVWGEHRQNLLFVIQEDCPWCEASAGLYRDLMVSNSDKQFRPIVVVPYSAQAANSQVTRYGLAGANVQTADLESIDVPGTPALLLVDSFGHLQKAWIGKLSPGAESAVFKSLGLLRVARTSDVARPSGYEAITAAALVSMSERAPVLDTRPRDEFRSARISGATNIPLDELAVRVPFEWRRRTTALYCERPPTCNLLMSAGDGVVRGECELAVDALKRAGVSKVTIIEGLLDELEYAGLEIERSLSPGGA